MLILSLIVSAILLVSANLFVYRTRQPVARTVLLSLGLAFGPIFLMFILPPVAIQAC